MNAKRILINTAEACFEMLFLVMSPSINFFISSPKIAHEDV